MPPNDSQTVDARLTILEYRQDKAEQSTEVLRKEYTEEHAALRKTLQGIEQNLSTIKYVAIGAGLAFFSQVIGLEKVINLAMKVFL